MTAPALFSPALLRPTLLARLPESDPCLDEHYFHSQATVMLSRNFAAGLSLGGEGISHGDINSLDLSLHQAWDRAATELLSSAQCTHGTRFRTRAATGLHRNFRGQPVWQVDCPGALPTSWLAHPYPFTVLHRHLTALGKGEPPWYYAPRADILLAAPYGHRIDISFIPARISPLPIVYQHGFPSLP